MSAQAFSASTPSESAPRHLVVVGGGISGLSAARAALEAADRGALAGRVKITLLEASQAVGGKALSIERNGFLVEGGPTGFLDSEPVLDRLVEVSGLTKLPASQAAARRFVVRGDKLREIQAHPLRFARSGILSPLGLLRIAREAFIPERGDDGDETVWDFAKRRLGSQAADRLIAPMVLGIFAGDAKQLSLPAAFPRMRELEHEYGSLLGAMRKLGKSGKSKGGPGGPGAVLTSFAGGLQSFPQALAERGGFEVRTGQAVAALVPQAGKWEVKLANGRESLQADGVVLATEPWAAAKLLPDPLATVGRELSGIQCPSVAVVALAFGEATLARVPKGFGALIPRPEGYNILGVLWDSHLFDGRSPKGTLLMRAMLGGAVDTNMASCSADELIAITRKDLRRLLGITESPIFEEVVQWPRAIPQYTLGHLERVARIEKGLKDWQAGGGGALALAGNALDGVAFGKAAARGWHVGEKMVSDWGRHSATGPRPSRQE